MSLVVFLVSFRRVSFGRYADQALLGSLTKSKAFSEAAVKNAAIADYATILVVG